MIPGTCDLTFNVHVHNVFKTDGLLLSKHFNLKLDTGTVP